VVRLEGENRIREFRQVAEKLVSKISSYEGVSGIVLIGGLVRGFADKFSDVDIMVFLSKDDALLRKQIRDVRLDEEKYSGIEIDLEIHILERFKSWRWDEIDKWELSKAEIVFDRYGETKRVFMEKLNLPRDYWIRRIAFFMELIKWYCCPPKDVGTIAESWIERGDLIAAHYCLNYSVDLLLKIIFYLNKEFLPPPKWRIFYSYELKWLPGNYKELLKDAMYISGFSVKDFRRRLDIIRKIWSEIVPRIEDETKMTLEQIRKYAYLNGFRYSQYDLS